MANKRITIEMDTCLDFTNRSTMEFLAFLEANDILFNVLTWHGPAGGNPLVHYNGTKKALRKMLKSHFGCDAEDCKFYMSDGLIKE